MSAAATLKTSAGEYFVSMSPVKDDGSNVTRSVSSRGGRCDCCPYGYHIDLDFVRYCHTLAKGCEQESATLRKLKQSKRQRRRATHSMEVMLGLTNQLQEQQQNVIDGIWRVANSSQQQPNTKSEYSSTTNSNNAGQKAPTPPPRRNSLKHLHQHLSNQQQYAGVTNGGAMMHSPPPDLLRVTDTLNSSTSYNISSINTTTSNRSYHGSTIGNYISTNDTSINSSFNKSVDVGKSYTTSSPHEKLKEPVTSESAQLVGAQRHNSSSTFTQASDAFQEAMLDFQETLDSSHESESRSPRRRSSSTSKVPPSLDLLQHSPSPYNSSSNTGNNNSNTGNNNSNTGNNNSRAAPQRKLGLGPSSDRTRAPFNVNNGAMATAMASMLAQSAVNRVRSASVTRSNSLPRYFPDESPHSAWFSRVRPSNNSNNQSTSAGYNGHQRELETLRVERQQLQRAVETAKTSHVTHRSDETQDAFSRTRTHDLLSTSSSSRARRRSQSPVRVNLEEFCSYRRARAGSISDCSDTESVSSEIRSRTVLNSSTSYKRDTTTLNNNKNSLFISEASETQNVVSAERGKVSVEPISQPSRRSRRDAATSCKVITRDVGIHHAARVRSVGVMADLLPPEPHLQHKYDETSNDAREKSPKREVKRPSLFSISRATQTIEEKTDPKSKLLTQLGRQNSSIIARLSEVQKVPPKLTFDNSTNTETKPIRNQGVNTEQIRTREQKNNTVLTSSQVMTKDQLDIEVNDKVKLRVQEQLERARKNWELDVEDIVQERLQDEMMKVEEKYKNEFESEVNNRVTEKVRFEMVRARQNFEQDINEEMDTRIAEELAKAKQIWQANVNSQIPIKPLTRERSVQAVIPLPVPEPQKIFVKEEKPPVRSVAAGEGKLTDILCDKCSGTKKSVGCSWDKISDVICDTCKERKHALTLKPMTRSFAIQTVPPPAKLTATNSCQTSAASLKTVSTNTTFLALKKEEPVVTSKSPVITPEIERRPFGSSGVNICDKCHDTITSVAKDIVGTSTGSTTIASGPPVIIPLPPISGSSKIPRLVDPFKPEQRLDIEDGPLLFRRDSDLRRSDSRIDQINRRSEQSVVQLRQRKDQTPDLISDSNIARDGRRNSGPPSADTEKTKVPFTRQQTYTKLLEGTESNCEESSKVVRKMSAFSEEDEMIAESQQGNSRKSSSGILTKTFRRERSSPEICMKGSWKKTESSGRGSAVASGTGPGVAADAWQKEMTSYSRSEEEAARASRSTSVDSTATYKLEDGGTLNRSSLSRRSPTPPCTRKDAASPVPPRKATPIPQQVAPPPNFQPPPPSLQSSSAGDDGPAKEIPATKPSLPLLQQTPAVPAIVRTSPPPPLHQKQQSLPSTDEKTEPQTTETQHKQLQQPESLDCTENTMHRSTTSVNDSELLDSGDESIVASSVVTQDSSVYGSSSPQQQRKKPKLGRNLRAALKVLNDSIGKPVRSGQQLTNALNIIQRDWFKVSSQTDSNPHLVEDYLDIFEMQYSRGLLHRVVNLADVNGNTAMHYAVSHGNYDVVSVLLDSKVCSVNQQNKAGYTATMLVSLAPIKCATHASVVERLISMSDVNVKAEQHGQTALMLAVSHGRLDTVRLLIAAGADVNIQDDDGSTAVMCAAEHGHLAIVRYLLQSPDTDAHLVDNDGSSALAIAVEAGHKDVGVLLYKHMNLVRGSSPYSSLRGRKSRTPTLPRSTINTPPPRFSAPPSPGRSRRGSQPPSPPSSHHNSPHTARHKPSSASLSNLNF